MRKKKTPFRGLAELPDTKSLRIRCKNVKLFLG